MSFVGDIIGGAANVFSSVYNAKSLERINERNIREARAAEEREREYNAPKAQMERLKDAGLNPNLIYGSGASTGNLNANYAESTAPQINASVKADPLELMRQVQELKNSKETGRALTAQADIAEHDASVVKSRPGVKSNEGAVDSIGRDIVGSVKAVGSNVLDLTRDWYSGYKDGRNRGFSVWKSAGLPLFFD